MPPLVSQSQQAIKLTARHASAWISALSVLFMMSGCTKKGAVKGKVTDQENHPLPGTHVEIVGTTSKAHTDQAGVFRLPYSPGKLTLHLQSPGHLSKSVKIDLPQAIEHTVPTIALGSLPSPTEAANRLRTALESLVRDSSAGSVRFGKCFTIKDLACTQALPGDDQYTADLQITLVSQQPFSWGQEPTKASVRVTAFSDIVGGFEVRNYPPGYTFTRALRATVDVDPASKESLSKVDAMGPPGADVLPASRDFSTFIVGQWNGGSTFDFHPDGTWSVQNAGSPADAKGRRWSIQSDTLTMVEPAHVTRYTKLSVQGQQLTLWNRGPLTLTRIQSVAALNVAPVKPSVGGQVPPPPTPSISPASPSPSPTALQNSSERKPTVPPLNTPNKRKQ